MGQKPPREPRADEEVVYTRYITLRNGKRLDARECGLTVFRFIVKKDRRKRKP